MGNKDLQHVTKVQQRGDNTIVVYIQTDNFDPGQEVEVSAYLTQGSTYAFYNDKKRIPLPDPANLDQPSEFHVELPKTELVADQPVTVVTRVTEVWPTVLKQDLETLEKYGAMIKEYGDQALKAAWTYQDADQNANQDSSGQAQAAAPEPQEPEGKAQGDPAPPPPSNADGAKAAQP